MKLILWASLCSGAALATIRPISVDHQIFEQLPSIPYPWFLSTRNSTKVDPNRSFKLRIHLKNRNRASFEQKVLNISIPNHADYGRHLTRTETEAFLAPSPVALEAVRTWLDEQGLAAQSSLQNHDWIVVDSTVGEVSRLLAAEYHLYEHGDTGKLTLRTLAYSLPAALHAHIDLVAPTIKFSTPEAARSTLVDWPVEDTGSGFGPGSRLGQAEADGHVAPACNTSITLDCLKDLYKTRGFEPAADAGNQFGLAGFLEQYAQHDDLATFLTRYQPDAAAAHYDFSTVLINGGLNTQQNTTNNTVNMGEANLDIQYAALAYPTPLVYLSVGGRPPETTPVEVDNEPYLEFLMYLLASDAPLPQTISISYGDSEYTVPASYAITVCNMFAQLAARGVSVLVSSGDSGAGSDCRETAGGAPEQLAYTPAFPASCPYVTTVGATYRIEPERAVSFSGGGFSNFFAQPAYQAEAVSKYLTTEADPAFARYYNASGRAYPDLAAQGVNFHVYVHGSDNQESGTSASSPVVAAIVAMLNGDRIARGLPPLGLLNPWLYSLDAGALMDIDVGKGSGCSQVNGSGFPAVPGWDPVTGLGTPNFAALRSSSAGEGEYRLV